MPPIERHLLLVCNCGDCRHWEIEKEFIICKSCGTKFETPGLGQDIDSHMDRHPKLTWKDLQE